MLEAGSWRFVKETKSLFFHQRILLSGLKIIFITNNSFLPPAHSFKLFLVFLSHIKKNATLQRFFR